VAAAAVVVAAVMTIIIIRRRKYFNFSLKEAGDRKIMEARAMPPNPP
jgi:hypothetical protein